MRGTERVEPSFVPFDIVFSDIDIVEPDLLDLSDERAASALTPLHVKGLPELVDRFCRRARAGGTGRSSESSTCRRCQ